MDEIKRTCITSKVRVPFIYRVYTCREGDDVWFEVTIVRRDGYTERKPRLFDVYEKAIEYYDSLS